MPHEFQAEFAVCQGCKVDQTGLHGRHIRTHKKPGISGLNNQSLIGIPGGMTIRMWVVSAAG
jgi:hypothetical protein